MAGPASTQTGLGHRWVGSALRDFPWIHLGIGLFGNTLFFIGSILFFSSSQQTLAIWMFVLGSFGMLLGSIGELLVRIETRRRGDN